MSSTEDSSDAPQSGTSDTATTSEFPSSFSLTLSDNSNGHRSLTLTEAGFKVASNEAYMRRISKLRKELNYIKETDWMYDPLDKMPPI